MKKKYKYLDLILCLAVAMMVISNTTAAKITQLSIFTVSVTVLYFPFTYIFGDVLTEVYGYKQARRATWILIFVQLLTALIYQLVVFLPPAPGFKNNEAFTLVFGQAPRIVVGGLIALFAGQFVNDFTMAKMKLLTNGKYLWIRTIGSTITGQFFDTTIFYTIALSNVIPTGLLVNAILSGWFVKSFVETVMTPVTYFVVGKLKKLENEDYFDRDTDFNPLIFQVK
ncbi:MAG: queuosine precursor transporter [Patescibacteria group bacterium]